MNNKEKNKKICQIAERDRDWAALRERKDRLSELINNIVYHKPSADTLDFILYFQCLRVALTEIYIYEEKDLFSEEIKSILSDKTEEGILKRLQKEMELWEYVSEKKNPIKKRFESMNIVKNIIWGYLVGEKEKIKNIIEVYPNITTQEDMALLVQCMSIILMELEINDIEIDILETGGNSEIR